ncbi:pH-response regulator protein palH/rim-21 [Phyllosticta citribraziliensis]|uniref:PH-response regulator protein palH/rim-21 n=1 Tax=Phyllosticta citribraziliensis TaxID=989973 RepID=A0ABR1L6M4_9PEZI
MPWRESMFGDVTSTSTPSASIAPSLCTPFTLPSDGVIILNPSSTITLTADALFTPACTAVPTDVRENTDVIDMQDPFYASVTPQVYATGAATVIAWMLVIMLLITPRTFFLGGPGGRSGLMGRRGMISGASGGASLIGVGSRPWLQKVAALTVAISMTIATADTFRVAEQQYRNGYMDATAIRQEVVGGLEIKISRLISDIFLLLAQVQTLIRLFPRHKEKVIIKWVGFALIILDMTFSSINNFMGGDVGRPRQFKDAIPALSYLFELALSMLYAAWVLYYSLTKRRYAYYHWMMYNITLVALLSIVAVMTPVVFFATDISDYSVAGWGDYFRWVGAAAASVIVWEWVERIEALEREDKKDGILGREIFDGDEMLDISPSEEVAWPGLRRNFHDNDGDGKGSQGGRASGNRGVNLGNLSNRASRVRYSQIVDRSYVPLGLIHSKRKTPSETPIVNPPRDPQAPPPIATPISRADTTSADSTVYAVRYHTAADERPTERSTTLGPEEHPLPANHYDVEDQAPPQHTVTMFGRLSPLWKTVLNPFKRRRTTPPPELVRAQVIQPAVKEDPSDQIPPHNCSRWDLKGRLGAFVAEHSEKLFEVVGSQHADTHAPVTIVPAQPRGGRTWGNHSVSHHTSIDDMLQNQGQPGEVEDLSSRRSSPAPTPGVIVIPAPPRSQSRLRPQTSSPAPNVHGPFDTPSNSNMSGAVTTPGPSSGAVSGAGNARSEATASEAGNE